MPLIRLAVALVAVAALMAVSAVRAGGAVVSNAEARQWLLRMHNAATQSNYHGTLVITSAGAMSSLRISNYCEPGQSFGRVEMLDGQPRQVLRHNDKVLTMWPQAKAARLEQREAIQSFPSLLTGSKEQLFESYEMLNEGAGRVAGRDAAVFLLRPRDDARFAQRLWAEQASGLLLRADVLGADGSVLETSAFTDVSIGSTSRPQDLASALKELAGWRVVKPVIRPTSLEAEGWQLKAPVAGFHRASCVKRHLDMITDAGSQSGPDVLQAVFADGLTHVSLFIEPYIADRHRSGGAVSGSMHTWMQQRGDHWVTVIGDVPMATLRQFASALERRPR